MYANGYEPKVGDKVRRKTFDMNMNEGEEGVVCFVGEFGRVKITGKPDNAGFNEFFFDLIARAVRYADGNDAAVGDLVECVKESDWPVNKVSKIGTRMTVRGLTPSKEGGSVTFQPDDKHNSLQLCGNQAERFKLIARACPYKVGDWVHSIERGVEFKILDIRGEHDGWVLNGTNGCYSWRPTSVAPGRLPCPYKIGDWVKTKNSEDFLPEYRNRVFQVTGTYRDGDGPWLITSRDVGTWNICNVDPAMPPQTKPVSIADEVREIIEQPWSQRLQTERLVDLINAKTTNADKTIIELNEKVANQKRELQSLNDRFNSLKGAKAQADSRLQSLSHIISNKDKEIADQKAKQASQAHEIAVLLRNCTESHAREKQKDADLALCYGKVEELGGEIVSLKSMLRSGEETIRALGDRMSERLDYKALYENLRNKLREVTE